MAHHAIDNSAPSDSDAISDGDNEIVSFKVAVEERLDLDHFWGNSTDTSANDADGFHRKVSLPELAAVPTLVNDQITLYSGQQSGRTYPELHSVQDVGGTQYDPCIVAPVGMIAPFAGSVAPTGWLACDGDVYLRADYPSLFEVIGTTYNRVGDLATEFRVPDLIGRSIFGTDNGAVGRLTTSGTPSRNHPSAIGSVGGFENHQVQTSEMPSHSHSATLPTSSTAGASHRAMNAADLFPIGSVSVSIGSEGGGEVHNNMPPYMALPWIIKAL